MMNVKDPFEEFRSWFQLAEEAKELKHEAFVLSTCGDDGYPSSRVLLFKELASESFIFYTNYNSRKGVELASNPKASMVFHWPSIGRQIRIAGRVEKTTYEQSNRYFQSRPRGSQISAYTSPQGQVIPSREYLENLRLNVEMQFKGAPIPCPPHWGGYKLTPVSIEFWRELPDRFHERCHYHRQEGGPWKIEKLAP